MLDIDGRAPAGVILVDSIRGGCRVLQLPDHAAALGEDSFADLVGWSVAGLLLVYQADRQGTTWFAAYNAHGGLVNRLAAPLVNGVPVHDAAVGPHHFSPCGRSVALLSRKSSHLWVWDMARGGVHNLSLGSKLWSQPAWDAASGRLLLCTQGQRLAIWDGKTLFACQISQSVRCGAAWVAGSAFVVVCEDRLLLYKLAPGIAKPALSHKLSLAAGSAFLAAELLHPTPLAVSFDGAHVLAQVQRRADKCFEVALGDVGSGIVRQHRVSFAPAGVSWATDGASAVLSSGAGDRHLLMKFA